MIFSKALQESLFALVTKNIIIYETCKPYLRALEGSLTLTKTFPELLILSVYTLVLFRIHSCTITEKIYSSY